jgi:hypothetical protein
MKPLIHFREYRDQDLRRSALPSTRKKAFLDILHQRYDIALKIGLLFFLFSLPLLGVFTYWNGLYEAAAQQRANSEIGESAYSSLIVSLSLGEAGALGLLFLLFSFPVSACLRVWKLLAYYEGLSFFYDAKKGIRQNGKAVFFVLLGGVLLYWLAFSIFVFAFFGMKETPLYGQILGSLPLVIWALVVLPVLLLSLSLSAVYSLSFGALCKTAFQIYVNSLLPCLGFALLFLAPFGLLFLPNAWAQALAMALYFFAYIPLFGQGFFLYSLSRFDFLLNEKNYPSLYHKGLFI